MPKRFDPYQMTDDTHLATARVDYAVYSRMWYIASMDAGSSLTKYLHRGLRWDRSCGKSALFASADDAYEYLGFARHRAGVDRDNTVDPYEPEDLSSRRQYPKFTTRIPAI